MDSSQLGAGVKKTQTSPEQTDKHIRDDMERFIKVTFDKLPVQTKILVAVFSALNSATTLTRNFDLPEELWKSVLLDTSGPVVGESEEVNWFKGLCDGILLVTGYS
jgi:hypothetical protein